MIAYTDITNFIDWFMANVYSIVHTMIGNLAQITFGGISLLGLIITINIVAVFLGIILNSMRITGNKIERRIK